LGVVPSLLFLFGVIFLPESPRWQIKVGQSDKAFRTLSKIGTIEFAETTLRQVWQSVHNQPAQSFSAVFAKAVRPAVLIGITLAVFQQLCGINIVFNYTSTIFKSVGADLNGQLFQTVAIGVVNMLFTI